MLGYLNLTIRSLNNIGTVAYIIYISILPLWVQYFQIVISWCWLSYHVY